MTPRDAVAPYVAELSAVRYKKAYWSTLHLLLAVPDICAALEATDGRASGQRYIEWCDRYVTAHHLTGPDWYSIRCAVLHQARASFASSEPIQYETVSFVDPDGAPDARHGLIDGTNLTLNIANMSDEMLSAIECWSSGLVNNSAAFANIARNARTVVRVQPKHVFLAGTYVVNQTTSST